MPFLTIPRFEVLSLLALLTACDTDMPPATCFPLPAADGLRVGATGSGMEENGHARKGALPGEQDQGTRLQGATAPLHAPKPDRENQGTYLGLGDLNGARLALAGTDDPVTLHDGQLVTSGRTRAPAIREATLVVRTADGRALEAQVTRLDADGGGDRFAVIVADAPTCAPGEEGVFVPGHWDETGAHAVDGDELTYACMNGVIAKCVDWGYAPWIVGAQVHQSCTRLARADYCGDGTPWTMDGTTIDAYDAVGVQTRVGDPDFGFEAAWGQDGAICVNETRYVINDDDGETIRPPCFADLPRCTTLEAAASRGAVLANDSAHARIAACD